MGLFSKHTVSSDELHFSKNEMVAILKVAVAMASADGEIHENETAMMAKECLRFGIVDINEAHQLIKDSQEMDPGKAIAEIATMNDSQKKYVCAYLGTMMAIDGDIDDKEMSLWKLISTLCKLPTMSAADAIKYMSK